MSDTISYTIEKRPEYWLVHAEPKCGLFDKKVIAILYEPLGVNPGLRLYPTLGLSGVKEVIRLLDQEIYDDRIRATNAILYSNIDLKEFMEEKNDE